MILLQAIVSRAGFRQPEANERRTELFRHVVGVAGREGAGLVLLPGGYWTVTEEAEIRPLLNTIAQTVEAAGVALAADIDVQGDDKKTPSAKKGGSAAVLPYFGFLVGRCGEQSIPPRIWRQTSASSQDYWDVPEEDVPGAGRIVNLGKREVGVLICGELFSPRARERLIAACPHLILDLGHISMNTGVTPNLVPTR
jgi:hypothetical protein